MRKLNAYEVTVKRTVTLYATVEAQAYSRGLADKMVRGLAEGANLWDGAHGSSPEIEVVRVEEL